MLPGWRDVIEGVFDITSKDGDAIVLVNFLDELTYRARSNLGRRPFEPLKKGMIFVGRLVRAGEDWISGQPSVFPASARDEMLAAVAGLAMRSPEAVFRNPAKPAEARRTLALHHETFVGLFGADLIVVPGAEVPGMVEAFHRHLAQQARRGVEPIRLAVGPVLHADNAVANKICALFGRAEVRDYVDVDAILTSGRYTEDELLNQAADHDPGFDQSRFAEALAAIDRLPDSLFQPYGASPEDTSALRERMHAWARRISTAH